jgi:hypothetical protein
MMHICGRGKGALAQSIGPYLYLHRTPDEMVIYISVSVWIW